MFERFTPGARRTLVLAQEEARTLNHAHIGTEHLLLGLMRDTGGLAAQAIDATGLDLATARISVAQIPGRAEGDSNGNIPFTPRAHKVIELSLREALRYKRSYIGSEHLLLGLLGEKGGVGAQILARFDTLPAIRQRVLELDGSLSPAGPGRKEIAR